jgi:hypothetical protein
LQVAIQSFVDARSSSSTHPTTRGGSVSITCCRALYSLLSTLYSLLSTLYSLLSTLYSLLSTLYSLLSTLYSLRSCDIS